MNKSLVALAVLAGFAGAAAAQSSVTLSGGVDLGVRQANGTTDIDGSGSPRSNLTFSGTEDLGNGNSAFFVLNHRFSTKNGTQNGANTTTAGAATADAAAQFYRNAWVGLKNNSIGDLRLGRMLFPVQELNGNYEAWATYTVGSIHIDGRAANEATASLRTNSAAYFRSASFGGLVSHLAVGSATGGGTQTTKGEPIGVGFEYTLGPAAVAIAYDRNGNYLKTYGAYARYNAGFATFYGQFERNPDAVAATAGSQSDKRFSLSAAVPFGAFTAKAGYRSMDRSDVAGKNEKFALGLDYALSKRTTIYTDVSKTKGLDGTTAAGRKPQADLGVAHKF